MALDALRVTLKTNLIAIGAVILLGTPAAYLIATRSFRARPFVLTLVELPLVLPPAVAGIGLLAAFGRFGLLGDQLDALGLQIGFTQVAVVLAVAFVAGPFYVRPAISAFEAVDPTLLAASRTLGAGPARTFGRVALPLAGGGLGAGAALAFARGLGRVRCHDHVCRQPAGRDADAVARDLPGVRRRLRRRTRDQRAPRPRQRNAPAHGEALLRMALQLDISHSLRAFRLAVDVAIGRETLALVGPSGAGKTTVLRVVAGLLRPEIGRVALGEEVWLDTAQGIDVAPERRRVGLVFQEYALFPHMSVRANVGFATRSDRGGRAARTTTDLASRRGTARHAVGWGAPARRTRARAGS